MGQNVPYTTCMFSTFNTLAFILMQKMTTWIVNNAMHYSLAILISCNSPVLLTDKKKVKEGVLPPPTLLFGCFFPTQQVVNVQSTSVFCKTLVILQANRLLLRLNCSKSNNVWSDWHHDNGIGHQICEHGKTRLGQAVPANKLWHLENRFVHCREARAGVTTLQPEFCSWQRELHKSTTRKTTVSANSLGLIKAVWKSVFFRKLARHPICLMSVSRAEQQPRRLC